MDDLGRLLMTLGALLLGLGALVWALGRIGLRPGQLPGDLTWRGEGWTVMVPLGTSLVLSLLLTLLLNLWFRSR